MAGRPGFGRTVSSREQASAYFVEIIEFVHTKAWKDENFLIRKYVLERRSIAQIARETLSSKSTIRKALLRAGVKLRERGKPGLRPAQVPYGYRMSGGLMVPHQGEQAVLASVKRMVEQGLSYRKICEFLSGVGVLTKRRGRRWHPEMIRRMLAR